MKSRRSQVMVRHDKALQIIDANVRVVSGRQTVGLVEAVGRVSTRKIAARHSVPKQDNAAVDGYAFAHKDVRTTPLPVSMPVSMRIAAGDKVGSNKLKRGTVARIFTGAPIPAGADTVVMQENCKITKQQGVVMVRLPKVAKGANCRKKGEDLKKGGVVVEENRRFGAADIAAVASVGVRRVEVRRKVEVVLFSTGNEISSKAATTKNRIADANAPMIEALANSSIANVKFGGILPDNPSAIKKAIVCTKADLIITTGGASMGEEDHIANVLKENGVCYFRQIAVKPGRPMMFGKIKGAYLMGLPGNPVAALACFVLYARHAILRLAGVEGNIKPQGYPMPAMFAITNKKPNRREFLRGSIVTRNKKTGVQKFADTGSGIITSIRKSDGLIEIDEKTTKIAKGQMVNFLPYTEFD